MGQARITGSLLWTTPAFNQLPLPLFITIIKKTFVKLQKLVGYIITGTYIISASLNYHQSLESGKRSKVPEIKNIYHFNDYMK